MKFTELFRSSCAATALGAMALAGSACSGNKPAASSASKPTGEVVAHVGEGAITVEDFKAKLAEQPPLTVSRMSTLQGKKEFLDNLTKFELLSQEAMRRGIDKRPQVQNTIKRILVQELVNEYYQAKIEPTDDELKAYYDKHKSEFQKPELRRVQQIFIAAPDGSAPGMKEARAKAKAKAEQLLTQIKAADVKVASTTEANAVLEPLPLFSSLAKEDSSDERTKNVGGDTRFEAKDSLGLEYSFQFATAVFGLTPEHRLSDVIETPKGFHIARLLGVQAPTIRTMDDPSVKNILRDHYVQEQRRERFEKFYEDLKKNTKVDVDEKVLAGIEVPAPKLPQPPFPGHGFPGSGMQLPHPPMPPPAGVHAPAGAKGPIQIASPHP